MTSQIYISKLKIKHSSILLFSDCSEIPHNLQAEIHFQNTWLNLTHPVTCTSSGRQLICSIDTDILEDYDGDWELILRDPASDTVYIPVLNSRVRLTLLLGRHFIRKKETVFFPMGGASHSFLLRCRRWQKQDHLSSRIKELSAFGIYKLFGRFIKKKHIWLVYEKFCITAQENGFYFFEYCMKNQKNHVYFILDKASPQWDYMQRYRKNIIPALSFRHILYLLTADLLISPDGKHHAYAWKPMPNPITRELNRQKLYFLQHGVLALKNVDHLFSVTSSSSVDYFTASSEFEKNIIIKHMGYSPDKVPVTGLARWDGLHDTSDPTQPVILLMPTWRSWLEGQTDEIFRKSSYYQHYTALLNDQDFHSYLKTHNLKLLFYIHPKLQEFIGTFHSEDSQIELYSFDSIPLNQLLMRCSMMITDYSSACWDVYYQGKPVLFYQFDVDDYNRTNGSYLNMEKDLFGDRCTEQEDLVHLIKDYAENGFQEKQKYAEMRKKYFAYIDHNNCQRTYEYIKSQGY